jgi:hypothetical protein
MLKVAGVISHTVSKKKERMLKYGITTALREVAKPAMDYLFGSVRRWFQKFMAPFWLRYLPLPCKPERAIDTSATTAVREFANAAMLGTTIFWAVTGAGKTTALHQGSVRVINWDRLNGTNVLDWFARQINWSDDIGGFFQQEFTTVVLDQFDRAMSADKKAAIQLVVKLTNDSVTSKTFNVLVCLNDPAHALDLLRDKATGISLLGGPFCGRCTEEQVRSLYDTPLAIELGTASGILAVARQATAPTTSIDLLSFRAAQAAAAWRGGEELLWAYRRGSV